MALTSAGCLSYAELTSSCRPSLASSYRRVAARELGCASPVAQGALLAVTGFYFFLPPFISILLSQTWAGAIQEAPLTFGIVPSAAVVYFFLPPFTGFLLSLE